MSSKEADVKALQKAILRWRALGPAGFAAEVLKAVPTPQQWQASEALVKTRRVSIRSGHGSGKTTTMAWTILWFLCCYYPCKVPATAPTSHQLHDVLWAELSKWLSALGKTLPQIASQFKINSDRFYLLEKPQESFAVCRTARPENPEALQGFHADNILFLIDEASGVCQKVFEVAEGALSTEGAFVLMMSNPTRQEGYFYESHHKDREHWSALHWDGTKSPLVSKTYIDNMRKKYGEESPIYQVRVRGNFCAAEDGVIPLALCEAAQLRTNEINKSAPIIWGVDVARYGTDSSCLAIRQGNRQLALCEEWYGLSTMQLAGKIRKKYNETPDDQKPKAISIDVIGIGAGVYDRLKELNLPVNEVNVADASSDDHYSKLRDELWYKCKDWLELPDSVLMDDEGLVGELSTPRYSILSNGRLKVESKDELKARQVASPNRADAFNLTFAKLKNLYPMVFGMNIK